MKKITSLFLLLAVSVFYCNAQESSIIKIRDSYNALQAQIGEEDMVPMLLKFNINRPGIGVQTNTMKFYWYSMSSEGYDDEEAYKNPAYIPKREIALITIEYNVAASAFYHIEYFFDYSENLVFYFEKSVETNITEKRLYFNDNKLIKELSRTYERNSKNENGKMLNEKTNTTSFSSDIKKLAEKAQMNTNEYKKYFQNSFKIEVLH